jgi:hypothetical protein
MQDVYVNLSVNFHRHQQHLAGAEGYVTAIEDGHVGGAVAARGDLVPTQLTDGMDSYH